MKLSRLQQITLALFVVIAAGWYWYVRSHAPVVASVNGTYTNACCGELLLHDGAIIAGNVRVPFQLENMKFGLTAYPSERIEVDGTQIVVRSGAEAGALSFDKGSKTLTLCGDLRCDRKYVFTRH